MTLSRFDFPPGFLFGAATAAYQIEGSAHGGCGPCHWDTFSATPGNVVRAENGSVACDHYHQWHKRRTQYFSNCHAGCNAARN